MLNFVIVGAAGYVAPKHIKAVKEIGGSVETIIDISDSVGIIDSYFKNAEYLKSIESIGFAHDLNYASICTPNYLHPYHCEFFMRKGLDVICEKPLSIKQKYLDKLVEVEKETGKRINVILQIRHHPVFQEAKKNVQKDKKISINVDYFTPRGKWYLESWKGDERKSGGLACNIGIHIFDALTWLYGKTENINIIEKDKENLHCELSLDHADVNVNLSIKQNKEPIRRIGEYDLTQGFTDLHTKVYEGIVNDGLRHGIEDIREATFIVETIKDMKKGENVRRI